MEPPFPVQPLTEVQVMGSICENINISGGQSGINHNKWIWDMNHLSFSQAIEAVINGQHAVTLDDANPDGSADSGVHPSAGSANVHDGHVDVALVQRGGSFIQKNETKDECSFPA